MEQAIQWFPGHMAKTRRKIQENLPLVDLVIELLDARLPASSRNPDLAEMTAGKPRVVLLTKADLADEAATGAWADYLTASGTPALAVDCKTGRGVNAVPALVRRVLADKIAAWTQRGMGGRAVRAMVVGIPNVGKSSFINRLARGGKAAVEDRPGVTRTHQWFVVDGGIQLLDTPGVLWPKLADQEAAQRLAYSGAIRDQVLDPEELACGLLAFLGREYPVLLAARYKLDPALCSAADGYDLLEAVGVKRGMRMAGGTVNTERAAVTVLDEFRAGKIGRITLDQPPV